MKVVGQVLRERARECPHADFVVCDSERLTYADAEARSRRLARGLLAEGVGKGSRVAFLYPTGIPFVVTWLAICRIGAVAVPVSTFSKPDELRAVLADATRTCCSRFRSTEETTMCARSRTRAPVWPCRGPV